MGRRSRQAVAGVSAVVLVLGGCSSGPLAGPVPVPGPGPAGTPVPLSTEMIADSRGASDAPEEVRSAADGNSCGEVLLDLRADLPDAARSCFESSMGVATSELVVVRPTVEGDALVWFSYTSPRRSGYDVILDQSRDRYGGDPSWIRLRCPSATTWEDPNAACA